MKKTIFSLTTLFLVLSLSIGWSADTSKLSDNAKQAKPVEKSKLVEQRPFLLFGQALLPAVFAFNCTRDEGDNIQNCPEGGTIPYGGNNNAQLTHSWFQMVNYSKFEQTSENSEPRLYLHGRDGNPVQTNDLCAENMKYNQDGGYIDLLNYAGDDRILSPGEAVFLYIKECANDGDDNNPPYYATLRAKVKVDPNANIPNISLGYHAGWEEIVETLDRRLSSKAGTLADKRILKLKPFVLLPDDKSSVE